MHARSLQLPRRAGPPALVAANDNHPPVARRSFVRRAMARVEREPTAFVLYLLMLGVLSVAGYVTLSMLVLGTLG